MFCDEAIEGVYIGQPKYEEDNENLFLDYYSPSIVLHLTAQYRIVLETANYYISIQTDGVAKIHKNGSIDTIEKEGEWLESTYQIDEDDPAETPWVEYEYTLFSGEKIESVYKEKNLYQIVFTDFVMKVVPHDTGAEIEWNYPGNYCMVHGLERFINKCKCGGTGELVIDFVSDYGIRCNQCHIGTSACVNACDAIDEWNDEIALTHIGEYPRESIKTAIYGPIEYLAIHQHYHFRDENYLTCSELILKVAGKMFKIKPCYAGNGKYDFSIGDICDFNPYAYPGRVISTEESAIRFLRIENEGEKYPTWCFTIGNKILRLTLNRYQLELELSNWTEEANWFDYENSPALVGNAGIRDI